MIKRVSTRRRVAHAAMHAGARKHCGSSSGRKRHVWICGRYMRGGRAASAPKIDPSHQKKML